MATTKSSDHKVNRRHISSTDPDASIVRYGGKAKLRYKNHRAVDSLCEVITAVEVTAGAVDEGHKMLPLIEINEANTGIKVDTVVPIPLNVKAYSLKRSLFTINRQILSPVPPVRF